MIGKTYTIGHIDRKISECEKMISDFHKILENEETGIEFSATLWMYIHQLENELDSLQDRRELMTSSYYVPNRYPISTELADCCCENRVDISPKRK